MKAPSRLLRGYLLATTLCLALPGIAHADLIGYWSLDGDADADAGGWGTSTVQTGANSENDISYPTDVPAVIAGRVSQSLAFDANNDDRIITGFQAGAAGISGTPETTITFWIKRSATTPNNKSLVYLGGATPGGGTAISMERSDAKLVAHYFNGSQTSKGDLAEDQWVHVAFSYHTFRLYGNNNSVPQVYFNGKNVSGVSTDISNLLNLPGDATVSLGARVDGSAPATAFQIAELTVWDEVLPANQIAALANGYAPSQIPIRDCDHDGIDDQEQLIETQALPAVHYVADDVAPDGIEGNPWIDGVVGEHPAPPALSDVNIILNDNFNGWVDAADEGQSLLIYVNGDLVGRALEVEGDNIVVVPQANWNSLRNGADSVEIAVEFSAGLTDLSFAVGHIALQYSYDRDVDDNGWLDECIPDGDPGGPDTDGDGVSDNIDRSPNTIADPSLVDAYGQLLRVARFDADEDGDVDVDDYDLLDAPARDVDEDGDADLHDLAMILHGTRGPGVAADPAFLQELRLFKAHAFGPEDLDVKPWHKPLPVDHELWYDLNTLTWKIDSYAPYETRLGYHNANERSRLLYGTHLAAIDKTGSAPLSQSQQISQLHTLVKQSGSLMSWIGMHWQRVNTAFQWENGQFFNINDGSLSAWTSGQQIPGSGFFTPGQDDYYVLTYDTVALSGGGVGTADDYEWLNADGMTPSLGGQIPEGFAAQLPTNTVPAALATSTETVTVTLDSSLDGQAVVPGQTIDWTISFQVSSGDNAGLALLVTDLTQDAGNPISFDLPVVGTVPTGMQNFAAPLGFTGPGGYSGQQVGAIGALDLSQIGGAQNTFGGVSSDTTQGQNSSVVSGIGQGGSTVLATGSFIAPATPGSYTFNLANTLASVLKTVGGAGAGSEIVPANITLAQSSFSIEVSNPPVITLLGDNPATHEAATPYTDAGATASDVEDGDITASIVVNNGVNTGALGSYPVTYNVSDSSGLPATEVTRTVDVVDTTPPVLTLLGENPVTIEAGVSYSDAGATALDSLEGDLTGAVVVSGSVDNQIPGVYVLTYNVADSSSNAATPVTRTVVVEGNNPPFLGEGAESITVEEATTGVVYRAVATDPDGGVRFDHPGYVALFLTDEGTGAGAVDALGSGLAFSFNGVRWTVEPGAPGGENVLGTQVLGDRSWFTVDNFDVTEGLTVSEWIRFDDIQTSIYDPLIWKFGDIQVAAIDGQFGVVGPNGISMATPFVDGEWAHLTLSIDTDGNATVYLNGAEILSGQVPFDSSLSSNTFGHDVNTMVDGLNGARSDLSIIDGTLSTTQAQMLYQSALRGHQGDVLRYSLGTAGDEAFFAIDAYTGELSLTTALHFETPLDTDSDNVYLVQVIATDAEGLSASQIIEVTLNNTNIAPVITGTLVDPIPEDSGYFVYDFTVADDNPGALSMWLDDNRFDIASDGADGYRVYRRNVHTFDYETNPDYDFNLFVSDGVEGDSVNIVFTLTNVNDSAPIANFTSAGPVTENDPGVVIGMLDLSDPDGETTFTIEMESQFEVAADGLTIKLKDGVSLDYEAPQSTRLLVIIVLDGPATDLFANYTTVNHTITVLDVNDVTPHNLQLSGLQVTENDPGAVIGTLSAVDQDGPTLEFSVLDARFAVQGNVLKLATGVALDREATPSVTLSVTASDGTFQGSREFTITVLNVDEGAPENITLSNASIAENTSGIIGQLSASDVDGDAISFSVTDSRFSVSGNTLSLDSPFDHEALPDGTVALEVSASGGGASSTATLTITVEDVNEAPTMSLSMGDISNLTDPEYVFLVLENTQQVTAGSGNPGDARFPASFQASDPDADPLSYVLGGADAGAFTVEAETGALLFLTPADFEAPADANGDGTYELSVSVSDGEYTSNTITLELPILDIEIEDTTPPVITLLGEATVEHQVGTPYNDAGATAEDAEDGDLSAFIVVNNGVDANLPGSYSVSYDVSDGAGNPAVQVTRTVNVVAAPEPFIFSDGFESIDPQ